MIPIKKPVVRQLRRFFMHYKRPIVVILEPGETIALRLKGTRTVYRIEIEDLYTKLALWHANAEVRRKREERKKRK